ncbi:sensor histidine kinase [Plantactinospora sp. GCM10030261]|uniref:sensor histidine kinase n=1 Tax=Plantactinospora sp. GCM10030261 TaxID=3273420 RepID=UPI00361775B5
MFTLVAGTAAWVAWFLTLHPEWVNRRGLMGLYYAGLLVLAGALVLHNPFFGFFAWIGYPHAFLVLVGRWRLLGVAGTAAVSATSQVGGVPVIVENAPLFGVVLAFNLGIAGAVTWFSTLAEQQSARQQRLVEELGEANRKLAATMRENEGLHAQLLTQARESGVLDERQRMAREIHDTIAQGLAGVITQLEAAEQARDRRGQWQRHVDTAIGLARESLTEARRSVRAVRPEPLAEGRLPDVLADVVDRWSAVNGVRASLTTTGTGRRLHPEIEVTLLRTAQEALANVAKHAEAGRVGLTLSYMEDQVTLDVRDDGRGFIPAVVPYPPPGSDGGYGLTVMRQRIAGVDGQLTIESEPDAGTAISASVPALDPDGVRPLAHARQLTGGMAA